MSAHAFGWRARRTAGAILGAITLSSTLGAQESQARRVAADSAFSAGDIPLAESLYYLGAQLRPRDPVDREALASYLAMHGASRIAAVLFEESRMFGGDPARIATRLAPLYESLGDWRALLSLPSSPLNASQRRRAAWLAEHPSTLRADSTALQLVGVARGDTIGRVAVRIGGRPLVATVVARDIGIVIGARAAGSNATYFGDSTTAVLDLLELGSVRLGTIPVEVVANGTVVVIGLSALSPMSVRIDYEKKRLVLNPSRFAGRTRTVPLFRIGGELRVGETEPARWVALSSLLVAPRSARVGGPITIDLKSYEVRIPY